MKKRIAKKISKSRELRLKRICHLQFVLGEILKARRLLLSVKSSVTDLDARLWKLEGHTSEESFQRCESMLAAIQESVAACEKSSRAILSLPESAIKRM